MSKQLFILIIIYIIAITDQERLTPLSECTKGRISPYTGWEKGGQCGFGPHKNATGSSYLYPISPNFDLFNSYAQCGACYEIVGPYGAIRGRVEDFCPKNDKLGLCSGDMYHFNVANNGSSYLIGDNEISTVTFRMVSCGLTGNVRILTDEDIDEYSFSFVVLDHNMPISYVSIIENGQTTWTKLDRNKNSNHWKYEINYKIYFPISIRIYSINNDYVTVDIPSLKGGQVYEAKQNFNIPDDAYFDINTFDKKELPENAEKCCKMDNSDFNPIYKNGILNDGYNYLNQKVTVDFNYNDLYQDQPSMNVIFQSFGEIIFKSIFPIRADQFSGVSLSIKTENNCTDCLNIRAYDLKNKNKVLQLDTDNEWKTYKFSFDTLGIENNEFNGIGIKYSKSTKQTYKISIGSIELLGVRNPPDAGVCVDVNTVVVPPVTIKTDIPTSNIHSNSTKTETDMATYANTDSYTEISNTNNTVLTKVNIISIESRSDYPLIININCEPFEAVNDERMILLFISRDNSNSFETESCILPTPGPISSFSCKIPNNIPNGVYTIESPSDNKYNIHSSSIASVTNGNIIFNPIDSTNNNENHEDTTITTSEAAGQEKNNTRVEVSPIIITNSIEQMINKGDFITFQISPIDPTKYNLQNKEIIFSDDTKSKFLYLKYCQEISENNMITSIRCTVSNNIKKGNYSILGDGQNISILSGQKINLISNETTGGFFTETISQTINTNLTESQKKSFSLTFNILYYNSSLKPGDLFPHRVYLYGIKRSSKTTRNLDLENYNSKILFPNCTAGSYSFEDTKAIGSIKCLAPDYIPAGTYKKLESDGFDSMPNSNLNLVFQNDFNRTQSSSNSGSDNGGLNYKSKSSSKSKKWIIWLILGIVVVVLAVVVLIVCLANRKGKDDSEESENRDNSNANISQNNKSSKSEES